MHMSKLLNAELEQFSNGLGRRDLRILETGCIRNDAETYRINDGWSTLTFAEWVRDNGGSSTSIDLDVAAAHRVLKRESLIGGELTVDPGHNGSFTSNRITLIQGYSVRVLANMLAQGDKHSFDLILLDSENDPDLILHEFFIARHLVIPGGLIMIDDVSLDPSSPDGSKGDAVVPWAEANGLPVRKVVRTGEGYVTNVVVLEM